MSYLVGYIKSNMIVKYSCKKEYRRQVSGSPIDESLYNI